MSYAQCDTTEIKLKRDSCTRVEMSLEMFTLFYKYKKNLDLVRLQLPQLQHQIDSLNLVNTEISADMQKEINDLMGEKVEYTDKLDKATKDNAKLEDKVKTLRRQRIKLVLVGVGTGALITLLIIL